MLQLGRSRNLLQWNKGRLCFNVFIAVSKKQVTFQHAALSWSFMSLVWFIFALDNGDGLCNSFDTTLACDDIIAIEDDSEEDDADSGVHNTPDTLNNNNSSDDIGDQSLDVLTHDSLYESLKYQQGNFSIFLTSQIYFARDLFKP